MKSLCRAELATMTGPEVKAFFEDVNTCRIGTKEQHRYMCTVVTEPPTKPNVALSKETPVTLILLGIGAVAIGIALAMRPREARLAPARDEGILPTAELTLLLRRKGWKGRQFNPRKESTR